MTGYLIYMTICPIMLELIALIFVSIEKMTFKNNHDKYSLEEKSSLSLLYRTPCFLPGREGCQVDLFHTVMLRGNVCVRDITLCCSNYKAESAITKLL